MEAEFVYLSNWHEKNELTQMWASGEGDNEYSCTQMKDFLLGNAQIKKQIGA